MTRIKIYSRIYGVKATTATYCFKEDLDNLRFTHLLVALNSKDAYSKPLMHDKLKVVGSTPAFILDEVAQKVER